MTRVSRSKLANYSLRLRLVSEGFDTLDLKEAKALLDELTPDNQFRNGLLVLQPVLDVLKHGTWRL